MVFFLKETPEENVEFFFKTAKEISSLLALTA